MSIKGEGKWPEVTIQKDTTAEGGWCFIEPGRRPRAAAHLAAETYVPKARLSEAEEKLAECFRLSGEDPDGAPDSMLAEHAVEAVRTLRETSDANCNEELELREAAEEKLKALELAVSAEVTHLRHLPCMTEPVSGIVVDLRDALRAQADRLDAALDSTQQQSTTGKEGCER